MTDMELSNRVSMLEHSVRKWKQGALLFAVVLAGVALAAAQASPSIPDKLVARHIVLVDEEGHTLAQLIRDRNGSSTRLEFMEWIEGKPVYTMMLTSSSKSKSGKSGFGLLNNGELRFLATTDSPADSAPHLSMFNEKGVMLELGSDGKHCGCIDIHDSLGKLASRKITIDTK